MGIQTTYSRENNRGWHSFGKVKQNIVVEYKWETIDYPADIEVDHKYKYFVKQVVYKRTFNNPNRKWEVVSEKRKKTDHIGKFTKKLKECGFSGAWPAWDAKPILCTVAY